MPDPCAFDACDDAGEQRVVVKAAEAASWALRPGLLEQADHELGTEGPSAAVGLIVCVRHAVGIEAEHFRARTAKLTTNEQRLLTYLQRQAPLGGAIAEEAAARLRMSEGAVGTILRRLRDAGLVVRSRYMGVDKRRRRVAKWQAVSDQQEPPAVQPTLGLEEEPHA